MSTQTFFKPFQIKNKLKSFIQTLLGQPAGNQLAHGRNRPARPKREEERGGLAAGLRPTAALLGRPGWLAEAEDSPVRARARRRGSATRPAAISGHGRAS